jgi:heterodisulfide reductase subunit A
VSRIAEELCCGCQICVNVCPYQAISFHEGRQVALVNEALCKGCGACAAACPCEAPVLMGFNNRQLLAQIRSAL